MNEYNSGLKNWRKRAVPVPSDVDKVTCIMNEREPKQTASILLQFMDTYSVTLGFRLALKRVLIKFQKIFLR